MTERAYWFDLDGTLLTYEESFERFLRDVMPEELSDAAHETFRRRLFTALDRAEAAPYQSAFAALAEEHDYAFDPEAMAESYCERELAGSVLVPGAESVLAAVATRYPVGILTNGGSALQRAKLETHGLDEFVDEVVISSEVGVSKPDTAIFELAMERLSAEESMYVGDNFEDDIAPARDAGFTAIHVRHDEGPPISLGELRHLSTFFPHPDEAH